MFTVKLLKSSPAGSRQWACVARRITGNWPASSGVGDRDRQLPLKETPDSDSNTAAISRADASTNTGCRQTAVLRGSASRHQIIGPDGHPLTSLIHTLRVMMGIMRGHSSLSVVCSYGTLVACRIRQGFQSSNLHFPDKPLPVKGPAVLVGIECNIRQGNLQRPSVRTVITPLP